MESNLIKLDSYGSRKDRADALARPLSIFSRSPLVNVMLAFFIVTDMVCMYTIWNQLLIQNPVMLITVALGSAMVLDVPMAAAGNVVAQARAGLRDWNSAKRILIGCTAAFLLVFTAGAALRIVTRDTTIDSGSSGLSNQLQVSDGEDEGDTGTAMTASLFLALLPAGTSLASFFFGLAAADPIRERIGVISKQRIEVQSHITELEQAREEAGEPCRQKKFLLEREAALYATFQARVVSLVSIMKNEARFVVLHETDGDPDSVTEVTASSATVSARAADDLHACGVGTGRPLETAESKGCAAPAIPITQYSAIITDHAADYLRACADPAVPAAGDEPEGTEASAAGSIPPDEKEVRKVKSA